MSRKNIAVIGAGFAGLAAATFLAQAGHSVTLFEKNDQPGGRARVWEKDGFRFDMGPSWYWMPDVFDRYFAQFGKKTADFYTLERLDPGYRIWFSNSDVLDVPADMDGIESVFEEREKGSALKLRKFLEEARFKYQTGMGEYVFKPSHSFLEYANLRLMQQGLRIQMFTNMSKHVRQFFKNPELIKLLEFPVLFLGATPQTTPALYSMMNYADLSLGTWYPKGGMNEIIKGMVKLAEEMGVQIRTGQEVQKITVQNKHAQSVLTAGGLSETDFVIAAADYAYIDQHLLDEPHRNYSEKYWQSRTMSPSSLIFYIGLNKKLDNICHHNLFFDEDFGQHAREIYTDPQWPSKPLFYVSATSVTDPGVAPAACENLFFLMPVAPGLTDTEELREKYFNVLVNRFESVSGQSIRENIVVKRAYAHNDFDRDYHSYKGNAYGLANTLLQTAFLKPAMRARHVKNLLFAGQLTVPGPGVPPSLISGEIAAKEALKTMFVK